MLSDEHARLLTALDDPKALAAAVEADPAGMLAAVIAYYDAMPDGDQRNLVALRDMKTADELDAMADGAPDDEKRRFVRLAALFRRTHDASQARKAAQSSEPVAEAPGTWTLPMVSMSGPPYEVAMKLCKGRKLTLSKVSGWTVIGPKPTENVYPPAAVVADMVARRLVVPGVGQSERDEPTEYLLSAIGWRSAGCLYKDRTAATELRVYEVMGTDKDTDYARWYRSVTADWRMRQVKRDTNAGWNRWSEFGVMVSERVTGAEQVTVECLFECGRANADMLELWHPYLNAEGYANIPIGKGHVVGKSVNQFAYEKAAELIRGYADARAAAKRAPKPPKPKLTVLDEGDDADELAAALGFSERLEPTDPSGSEF